MNAPTGSESVTAVPEAKAAAARSHQKPRPVIIHRTPAIATRAPCRGAADAGLTRVPSRAMADAATGTSVAMINRDPRTPALHAPAAQTSTPAIISAALNERYAETDSTPVPAASRPRRQPSAARKKVG